MLYPALDWCCPWGLSSVFSSSLKCKASSAGLVQMDHHESEYTPSLNVGAYSVSETCFKWHTSSVNTHQSNHIHLKHLFELDISLDIELLSKKRTPFHRSPKHFSHEAHMKDTVKDTAGVDYLTLPCCRDGGAQHWAHFSSNSIDSIAKVNSASGA